jgi:hypothetical protein
MCETCEFLGLAGDHEPNLGTWWRITSKGTWIEDFFSTTDGYREILAECDALQDTLGLMSYTFEPISH